MNLTKQRERLNMTILNKEQTYEVLKGLVEEHFTVNWDKELNGFEFDVYVERDDKLGSTQIDNILQSSDPQEAFYEEINEFALQCADEEHFSIRIVLLNNWNEEDNGILDFDYLLEFMEDHVYINFPYDHYMKSTVYANVMIDAGDGNYDYTCNNFMRSYYHDEDEPIDEESGLLWLVRQQGYTKEDLEKARQAEEYTGNKFMDSVIREAEHVTSSMNALTFFLEMTLEDVLKFKEESKALVIDPSTNCGLFDTWAGAGALLEINLEREFAIPADKIDFSIDGQRGYSVDSVYGIGRSLWKDSFVIAE
jgi:hypothetical protein